MIKNKVLLVFLLFASFKFFLFAQNEKYGLTNNELNLIMGQFLEPRNSYDPTIWRDILFSWGMQRGVNNNTLSFTIDYNINISRSLGKNYEGYLTLNNTAEPYVIINIEKINTKQFLLYLIFVGNGSPKNAGIIKMTFLDDQHLLIDNSLFLASSFEYRGILWRCAGPTKNQKLIFPDLPEMSTDMIEVSRN